MGLNILETTGTFQENIRTKSTMGSKYVLTGDDVFGAA